MRMYAMWHVPHPLHCVPKKDDSWCPTGDYRPLNNLTVPDTYPLPHLQSFTDCR